MRGRSQRPAKFETRGARRARKLRTAIIAGVAFVGSFGIGITSLWIWPTESHHEAIQPLFTSNAQADTNQPHMGLCGSGQRVSCVVDGDTIWLNGEKIRIADIDTPEIGEPQCNAEYQLGMKATYRLRDLLNEEQWSVQAIGNRSSDQYGRSLRVLTRNGQSIGDMLVAEGLARTWTGRREPWC